MNESAQQVLFSNEAFYLAFSQKDVAAMDAIWSRTAPLVCVHPGWRRLTERKAIMESWRRILENPDQPGMDFLEPQVHDHGAVMLVTCYEALPNGVCLATNGFVYEGERWQMVLHHSGACAQPIA
ncbi:MAG: nuclear transport factor 2 family protein [Pseudomonadales bacterium]